MPHIGFDDEFVMDFGKHRGTKISKVPTEYLQWMCREGCRRRQRAVAELKRRGLAAPEVGSMNPRSCSLMSPWDYDNDWFDDGYESLCDFGDDW